MHRALVLGLSTGVSARTHRLCSRAATLPRSGAWRLADRLTGLTSVDPAPPPTGSARSVAASAAAAAQAAPAAPAAKPAKMVKEHSTQSNWAQAVVKHSDFELDVDFDSKTIDGHVKHKVELKEDEVGELVVDTRGLQVASAKAAGAPAEFSFGEAHKVLGMPLKIKLPDGLKKGDHVEVEIEFSTSPDASALQWLEPSQTAGGKKPYLFTQCQAIHARSFVPCQDTPGAKMTYSAAVRVPADLTALMSAVPAEEAEKPAAHLDKKTRPSSKVFRFSQPVPIATYLLALAVGELESRELGPISRVWSEPSMVEAAAHEFADTPKFLEAAEEIAGPYVWGRYDLLLLPPSFPYGGMENPCLTFVTPTLLAGDRSLANVVAHEIAHSWTGNLVTNASWESFWLNEGWTVWLERKILGRLEGEKMYQFHASMGFLDLRDEIKVLGASHPFTRLVPDLSGGIDPDDAFSRVPYEKGFAFLHYLQELVGSAEFEKFFRAYVQEFKGKTLTSDDFKAYFTSYFADSVPAVAGIDWDTWFFAPGMPPQSNTYDESLAQGAYDLAVKWHTVDVMGIGAPNAPAGTDADDLKGWSSQQIVAFLEKLGELRSLQALHPSTTRRVAELYKLDESKNSEIRCSWYLLCVKAGDEAILPKVTEFLKEQGRMKFLRPLYRALFASKLPAFKEAAVETFKSNRQAYHPIAAKMVAADLKLS